MKKPKKDLINSTFYDQLYYNASILSGSNYSPEYRAIGILTVIETMTLVTLNNLILSIIKVMNKYYFDRFWQTHKAHIGIGIMVVFIFLIILNFKIFFNRGRKVMEHFNQHPQPSKLSWILVGTIVILFFLSIGFLNR